MANAYRPRLLDPLLTEAMTIFSAVALNGPRAAGKTTTARQHVVGMARLDRPAEAAAFLADPDDALRRYAEPLLLDEWQEVPQVLGAVKRAVDEDPRPGRFLLTGSVRADMDVATWPGTGRVIRLQLGPMTLAERAGDDLTPRRSLIDHLFTQGADALEGATSDRRLSDYLTTAMAGGFPPLVDMSPRGRQLWLASYVADLVARDALDIDGGRDPDRLRRWFRAYASITGQVVTDTSIWQAADIDRRTGVAYEALLTALQVLAPLTAWRTNELARVVDRPKRHLVDAALAGPLLGVDTDGVLREGRMFGPLLETFVVSQLRPLVDVAQLQPTMHHLRDREGHEVDIVLEAPDRRLVAIEVKATATPSSGEARGLRWLRERTGDRVVASVLLHTGPTAFWLPDQVLAAPIAALL